MKKLLFISLTLLISGACFSQIKISQMVTFSGNAEDAYVPIVVGGVNYKTLAKNFVAGKVDSLVLKEASGNSPDTLYSYTSGARKRVGIIQKGSAVMTTVADTTARNAIASEDRYEGMLVYVADTQKYYSLKGGITNSFWTELAQGETTIISTGSGVFIDNF